MDTELTNGAENKDGRGCLNKAGGCLLKIVGFILMVMLLAFVKTCSRSMMKSRMRSYAQTECTVNDRESIDAELYKAINEMKTELPKRLDEVTIQKDVIMDSKYFYYVCDIDDSATEFATLDQSTLKTVQQKGVIAILPGMRKLVEVLIKTNRGLAYRYYGTSSGVTRDITFSCQELQNLLAKV